MRNYPSCSLFGAFVGGAIIGGALALLFAPRSGAETREMIRDFVEDEVDMVREKASEARDYVEGEIDRYKRKARRAVGKIEGMVEQAKDRVGEEIKRVAHV
jgi:gas vesicle protein